MKCLKIARLQDFALNTPELLGALSGPQTLCREVRDSHCESTNPPLEIPVYGPGDGYLSTCTHLKSGSRFVKCLTDKHEFATSVITTHEFLGFGNI